MKKRIWAEITLFFDYDCQRGFYICPPGNILRYWYTTKREAKVYAVKNKECIVRPEMHSRHKDKTSLTIYLPRRDERLLERTRSFSVKKIRRIMQITTEPLFAEAKERDGLSKFMRRGIEKSKKNSILIASVQNLKRILMFSKRKFPNEMVKKKITLIKNRRM